METWSDEYITIQAAQPAKAKQSFYPADDEVIDAAGNVAQPLCEICYHHHTPIHKGGYHLD